MLFRSWEEHGSGLIAFHGQSGDIMFQGARTDKVQDAFDELNELGFDLGGAGPAVRTSMSCVGAARCEQSCYDEAKAHRQVINTFLDDIHRPALPYKFKFKFSGCPNDCMNSIQRSDMAVIGTWRDNMRTDEGLARKWFAEHGMNELVNNVISRCPTKTIMLKEVKDLRAGDAAAHLTAVKLSDTHALEIDNKDCVRCMHCVNVMTGALAKGCDTGATILIGGKRTLKIGDLMGTVVVPFLPLAMWGVAMCRPPQRLMPALEWLGTFSLPLYCVHLTVLVSMSELFGRGTGVKYTAIAAALALSYLFFRLVSFHAKPTEVKPKAA